MRLLQSVLSCLQQTKKPQRKFVTHVLGLLLMLPGHATFRHMSRYSPYHERIFSWWYNTSFYWVSFNKIAITEVVPSDREQVLVLDASSVPKSGNHTYGLDRFWNGSNSHTERGLESSFNRGFVLGSSRTGSWICGCSRPSLIPCASYRENPHEKLFSKTGNSYLMQGQNEERSMRLSQCH